MISLLISSLLTFADVSHYKIQLNTSNTVVFRGGVDSSSVTKAQKDLLAMHKKRGKKKYKIYLVMDSPGGSIYDGMSFIDFAKTIPNVDTVSMFAASMASAIVQALPGTRYATPNGIMMYHRAKGSFSGQFEDGEVESMLALWKKIVRKMEKTNATRMSIPLKKYKSKVKDEWWMFGEENVVNKSVDAILHISCSKELMEQEEEVIHRSFFGTRNLKYSRCPLFRSPL
jgi:ATP-dependent protease ClpP protease subunit